MAGWIKLYRQIMHNPIFQKPDLCQLFCYCILRANHSKTKIIWNGEEEELEKGCFITGRRAISSDTGQNESAIYRNLKVLEKLNMISVKSNNKYSVVKVLNYGVYQGSDYEGEQPVNNQRTTTKQLVNTDKNDQDLKNDKNDRSIVQFEEFWKLYPKKTAKTAALKTWNTLIRNKTSPDDLIMASKNYSIAMKGKNQQYILQASTFLGPQKRFEDYINGVDESGLNKKPAGQIASGEAEADPEWPISNSFTR